MYIGRGYTDGFRGTTGLPDFTTGFYRKSLNSCKPRGRVKTSGKVGSFVINFNNRENIKIYKCVSLLNNTTVNFKDVAIKDMQIYNCNLFDMDTHILCCYCANWSTRNHDTGSCLEHGTGVSSEFCCCCWCGISQLPVSWYRSFWTKCWTEKLCFKVFGHFQ